MNQIYQKVLITRTVQVSVPKRVTVVSQQQAKPKKGFLRLLLELSWGVIQIVFGVCALVLSLAGCCLLWIMIELEKMWKELRRIRKQRAQVAARKAATGVKALKINISGGK